MERTMVQALNRALDEAMEHDPNVVILGEDIGKNGGVFRVTDGLWNKYGDDRVIDTPLAESCIVGAAIGMAVYGLRPIAEIQFMGFMPPALDQLISHAARIRSRSRGHFSCPFVVRCPYGAGGRAPEHHSESTESLLIHTPGLSVVVPSSPYDAKGLLAAALHASDPVIFLEPKKLYRSVKEDVPDDTYTVPLGAARVVQEGNDVTLIAWGSMVQPSITAANSAGVSVEILDLRTLSPFDVDTIIRSVKKTGKALIVHEAPKTLGFGAELAATIQEKAFYSLEKPIQRGAGYDAPIPLGSLERSYVPDERRIERSLRNLVDSA